MAQVLKAAVRDKIEQAALSCFADKGYERTSMADIAALADTAPANLYRYFSSKEALFAAVIPADMAALHDGLLSTRVTALARMDENSTEAAQELVDFWLEHRLAMVILLERADGTPVTGYPAAFVARLVEHAQQVVGPCSCPEHGVVLELIFDNTRRALARILHMAVDREQARALVHTFWSYQVPGLAGLIATIRADHQRAGGA